MNLTTKNNDHITVSRICETIKGEIVCGNSEKEQTAEFAFSSDLMSDVLTLDSNHVVLITGLANPQVIRTAEMSDISLVIIGRGKKCSTQMIELARDCEITLIESPYSIFRISGLLFQQGVKPIF